MKRFKKIDKQYNKLFRKMFGYRSVREAISELKRLECTLLAEGCSPATLKNEEIKRLSKSVRDDYCKFILLRKLVDSYLTVKSSEFYV